MAEISLPSGVDWTKKLPYLPENVSTSLLSVQATNGTTFTAGNVVQFDLPARSGLYLDGKTMFIRYKMNYTSGATAPIVRCTPAYSFIQKLDEYVGSTPVNSVYNYHQVANLWVNTRMSVADKFGQASALGFTGQTTPSLVQLDSLTLSASQSSLAGAQSFSAPLVCSAFSSADHYIPTGLMSPLRLQFTLAPLADICTTGSTDMTAYQISNFELCVSAIDLGAGVDAMVASMGNPKLYIKTTAWANAGSQQIASGSSGTQSLVFNHRYQSIVNAYLIHSGAAVATDLNAWGDSRDITSGGSYQLQIGQMQYPLLPIDVGNNKPAVLQYLRECTGSLQDFRNSMSIGNVEFAYLGNSATATTPTEPAKFIVGFPLEKIQGFNPYASGSLMSGVNASSTPIIANVRIASATTTQAYNPFLVVEYTSIIEVDPIAKQINLLC